MFLMQSIFKFALILCMIIGIAFMISSTVLVLMLIISGSISIQIDRSKKEITKEVEDSKE